MPKAARIQDLLNGRRKSAYDRQVNATKDREQSERVAWPVTQMDPGVMALLDCGMAAAAEVYLPYLIDNGVGHTVYELFEESRFRALPEAKEA